MKWAALLLVVVMGACGGGRPEPEPTPPSAWGAVMTVAQAEQMLPAAVWPTATGAVAAWVGADAEGPPYQALRLWGAGGLGEAMRLPLAVRPMQQRLMAATDGRLHLFWLDSNVEGQTRLFTALLKPTLERERELTILTEQATVRYALLPGLNGGVWALAAGGLVSEPSIYAHFVDAEGRPRFVEDYEVVFNADWPAPLVNGDGSATLFWLRKTDGQVMESPLLDGRAIDPQAVMPGLLLNPADRLEGFEAAQDATHRYLFWRITRGDGRQESWFSSAARADGQWGIPARVMVQVAAGTVYETGFNGGAGEQARAGEMLAGWVRPMSGLFDRLATTAVVDGSLGVLYWQAGTIRGYQAVVTPAPKLLAAAEVLSDRDRHLYLIWSEPTPAGYANLNMTTTRRLDG